LLVVVWKNSRLAEGLQKKALQVDCLAAALQAALQQMQPRSLLPRS
jgi:hypothetical protein